MSRRVGRYTKKEITELLGMYDQGFSVYKICRNLNRSQKSIRNNLIRLGKIEGEITPKRYLKSKNIVSVAETKSSSKFSYVIYCIILLILTSVFIVFPRFNILETILFNIFYG